MVPQKIVSPPVSKVELPHNPSIDRYLHFRQEQKRMGQVFNLPSASPIPEYPVPALAGKADKIYKMAGLGKN